MHKIREWQIYSKRMRIRRDKIKEDKGEKLYVLLKLSKMNMCRQYIYFDFFIYLLFSYNIQIKVNVYVKLKLSKMNS